MKTVSLYDTSTGLFTDRTISASSDAAIALNTPAGQAAMVGRFDSRKQRVDIASGKVIDYVPPAAPLDPLAESEAARREIAILESSQHRAVREILLGRKAGLVRLAEIDKQIAELEKKL